MSNHTNLSGAHTQQRRQMILAMARKYINDHPIFYRRALMVHLKQYIPSLTSYDFSSCLSVLSFQQEIRFIIQTNVNAYGALYSRLPCSQNKDFVIFSLLYPDAIFCFDSVWKFKRHIKRPTNFYVCRKSPPCGKVVTLDKFSFYFVKPPIFVNNILKSTKQGIRHSVLSIELSLLHLCGSSVRSPLSPELILTIVTTTKIDLAILYHYASKRGSPPLIVRLGFILECYIQVHSLSPQEILIFFKFQRLLHSCPAKLFLNDASIVGERVLINRWSLIIPLSMIAQFAQAGITIQL